MSLACLALVSGPLLVPVAPAAAPGGGPGTPGTGGVVPTLAASAPELGSLVTVTVADALPGAPVGLAYAAAEGALATPFGTAWLDPATLVVLATGVADAGGEATFAFALPVVASLAEAEVHLQAYVVDAAATGGAALTNSIGLRLLGSRLYVGVTIWGGVDGLLVKSAVDGADVFLTDFPSVSPAPVLTPDRALGAVATGEGELRVFDNFFGDTVHVVPAVGADPELLPDAAGERAYVRYPDRIERVELASGTVTGTLPLPAAAERWAGSADGSRAYLAELEGTQTRVRIVDLVALADLGTVPVGPAGEEPRWIDHVAGTTLVVTTKPDTGTGSHAMPEGTLSRLDDSSPSPTVTQTDVGATGDSGAVAVPALDLVLTWQEEECNPYLPSPPFEMAATPLSAPGPPVAVAKPTPPFGAGCVRPYAAAADGTDVWVVDRCCQEHPDSDEPGAMWRLDATTLSWSAPAGGYYEGPYGVVVVDDPFGTRIYTAHLFRSYPSDPGEVIETDPATFAQTVHPITLGWATYVGFSGQTFHAVRVP